MVHLSEIKHEDATTEKHVDKDLKKSHLKLANDADCFTTSVYGSRFASSDLPRHEMPEGEMPKEVAYRMIKDELSLDGNPMLKCARVPFGCLGYFQWLLSFFFSLSQSVYTNAICLYHLAALLLLSLLTWYVTFPLSYLLVSFGACQDRTRIEQRRDKNTTGLTLPDTHMRLLTMGSL